MVGIQRNIKDINYLNKLFEKACCHYDDISAQRPEIMNLNKRTQEQLQKLLALSERIDRQLGRIQAVKTLICRQIVKLGLEPHHLRAVFHKLLEEYPLSEFSNEYIIVDGELRQILAPGQWQVIRQIGFIWFFISIENQISHYEIAILDAMYYKEALAGTSIIKMSKERFDAEMLMEQILWKSA